MPVRNPKNPELEAGSLDKRVTLLRPAYNEFEDEIVDWDTVAEVWAGLSPTITATTEPDQSGRTIAITTTNIAIRYRADLDARWRIGYGARVFEIIGRANANERNAQLELVCKEVE